MTKTVDLHGKEQLRSSATSPGARRSFTSGFFRRTAMGVAVIANFLGAGAYAQQRSAIDNTAFQAERNSIDGTLKSITFPAGTKWAPDASQDFFQKYLGAKGNTSMVFANTNVSAQGVQTQRYSQYYKGIKVLGGDFVVLTKDNVATFGNGNYYDVTTDLSATPSLSEATAREAALKAVPAEQYMWQMAGMETNLKVQTQNPAATFYPSGKLVWIEDRNTEKSDRSLHLAYEFNVYAVKPLSRKLVYVDANNGKVLFANQQIHNVGVTADASGASLYSGTVAFKSSLSSGTYTMFDIVRGTGINTFDLHNTTGSGQTNVTSVSSVFATGVAIDAHWGAEKVYDYWKNVRGRNSYDNANAALNSYVHFSTDYDNAFWDGSEMIYGDGSGSAHGGFDPLAALDVCAHEIGHAVCQYTANLDYNKESGAMNEGFSDIWGAVIENYANPHESDAVAKNTWLIGEEISGVGNYLRSMSNPNTAGQPDTYGGTYWYSPTGCTPSDANDQCGVHYNSGVLNYWFYLMCQGGSGTNDISNAYSVTGIGITEGAQIAYQTELLLSSTSNFAACRTASIAAATTLFGACSPEVAAVTKAWYAVGVGANYTGGGVAAITGTASVCAGSTTTLADATTGGTWSSSMPSVATIGSATGIVTGAAAGTAVISYTTGSCTATRIVTVTGAPSSNTGTASACVGATSTLSNAVTGGTWGTANGAIATVGSSSGIVTGVAAGTVNLTYSLGGSCRAITIFTVNAMPAAITGTFIACQGSTTTLGELTTGGTWSSASPSIASVGSTGIVTGNSAGSVYIAYTAATGCVSSSVVTINPLPAVISGATSLCWGGVSTLTDGASGGTWTSSAPAVATIGSASGVITAAAVGTANITYTLPTGCKTTTSVNVSTGSAITGTMSACIGATTALGNPASGGTWSSSTTGVATIGSASGVVTGVAAGTSRITYMAPGGCTVTAVVTINSLPAAIAGTFTACAGSSATLTDATTGGTWSSSNTYVATIGTSGIFTGVGPGTTTITYTSSLGCVKTATVTINALPAVINGNMGICAGNTFTLSNDATGGTWTSSNAAVATVGSATGVVTGVAGGTAIVSYTLPGGCRSTIIVTINAMPAAIGGTAVACSGTTATLTEATTGGTWSSSIPSIASVGTSGIVSANEPGQSVISYTTGAGCIVSKIFTVNATPEAISGSLVLCGGTTSSLGNVITGGTWVSGTTTVATIGSSTGVLTGVAGGTSKITYTVFGGCKITQTITVNALPAVIGGTLTVCNGATTALTNATTGGSWTSDNTDIATVGTSGVVSTYAPGTTTISYTLGTGCSRSVVVTVNNAPTTIYGDNVICVGETSSLINGVSGGTWTSSNAAVATVGTDGTVTGVTAGIINITYAVSSGCKATMAFTVGGTPAAITGTASACMGGSSVLATATTGGTWSSSIPSIASVGTSGTVSANEPGQSVITYTSAAGCTTTRIYTVNAVPTPIAGSFTLCASATTSLTDAIMGGTWTSSTPAVATVGSSSGVVTGVAAGTSRITYTLFGGCSIAQLVTVTATPAAITGTTTICKGTVTTLADATTGGSWSSDNTDVATVGTNGVVSGIAAGPAVISYSLGTGCAKSVIVTIKDAPTVISGTNSICAGGTSMLTNGTEGGTWSSSNTAVATVGTDGTVTGVAGGVVTITYAIGTGCKSTYSFTVNATPATITGTASACQGTTSALASTPAGGTWSSSIPSIASVGTSGIVSANEPGQSMITYTTAAGCTTSRIFTVNAVPEAFYGSSVLCAGATTTLSDVITGGTWVSGTTTVATIGSSTGIVTGVAGGTSKVTYTVFGGCKLTQTITVNALPAVIGGTLSVCEGATTALTETTTGGTWTSDNTAVATVGTSGVVSGLDAGSVVISYTLGTGCARSATVTVKDAPSAITGANVICVAGTSTLYNTATGGTWTSSNGAAAPVSVDGVVTGSAAGVATITYTLSSGCRSTYGFTVSATPSAITGTASACMGTVSTLADATAGGSWSSSIPSIATVGSTGIVSANEPGEAVITYATAAGCSVSRTFTVNVVADPIMGANRICAGSVATLTDALASGTWSSVNTGVATIGSSTGIITGVASGVTSVSYTMYGGCKVGMTITVNAIPVAILGTTTICKGTTTTLTDATTGGTWSSDNMSVASVGTSGIVSGVDSGSAVISYTLATGCARSVAVTVKDAPTAIGGVNNICVGATTMLYNGTSGGSWSSSNAAVAAIGTDGTVTGVAAGTASITYAVGTGCKVILAFTVSAVPSAITGTASACVGSTSALSSGTGGTWSSSIPSIATVGSTGIVSANEPGYSMITYTSAAGCSVTREFSVNAVPEAITASSFEVCVGQTTTLSNVITGGTWTSSNAVATVGSSTGIVTGVTAGNATITYTAFGGCKTTQVITVDALPAAISGPSTVCSGATVTFTDATTGGVWGIVFGGSGTAEINEMTGVLTAEATGTVNVAYSNGLGCMVQKIITVNPAPTSISGELGMCTGHMYYLYNGTPDGTWSISNTAVATIAVPTPDLTVSGPLVSVTGVAAGTTTITYAVGSCITTAIVTVNASAASIVGASDVCVGTTITLTDATPGGTWVSYNTSSATIDSNGIVTGISEGFVGIVYQLANHCDVAAYLNVTTSPGAITGLSSICKYGTATYVAPAAGGVWTSSNMGIAAIGSSDGVVTAIAAGSITLSYTIGEGCTSTFALAVVDAPGAITGTASVCVGQTTTVANENLSGEWTSGNSSVATIGAGSGVINAVAAGTATITYTVGSGCFVTTVISVNAAPSAISGTLVLCPGFTSALSNTSTGGTWSSDNGSVATVGSSSGVVTAVAAGNATITYTAGLGCAVTAVVTINAAAAPVTGIFGICPGTTTTLFNADMTGSWSSTNAAIATVGSASGIVSGVAAGTVGIVYTPASGCAAIGYVTVNPIPGTITGTKVVCRGASATLGNSLTGGTWTSSNTANVTIDMMSGMYNGVNSGTATITYTSAAGCSNTTVVTVNATTPIAGAAAVCEGSVTTLNNATTGGTWTSVSTSTATIGSSSGIVNGLVAGNTVISYVTAAGCVATTTVTVNSTPGAIGGTLTVCAGLSSTLSNSVMSGVWTSSNTTVATVGSASGVFTGASVGTSTISYTVGSCRATAIATVTTGAAAITGNVAVCAGGTFTLADATAGGTWTTSDASIADVGSATGIVTTGNSGNATVTYTIAAGCSRTVVVTANANPSVIGGTMITCIGSTSTLTNTGMGGTWSSSFTSIVNVGSASGAYTGLTGGTAVITYTMPGSCKATTVVTVSGSVAAIGGTLKACPGTSTTLTNATSGGSWSGSDDMIATVGSATGIVSGNIAGTITVVYTTGTGCTRSAVVTINPLPAAISGSSTVCVGATTPFTDASTPGLSWTSSNTAVASVNSASGVVTGVAMGAATITYTLNSGCTITKAITVTSLPGTITGTLKACSGLTSTLTSGSGTWSSSNATVATVGSATGVVTGVAAGTATITYSEGAGCTRTAIFTVNPTPAAIGGSAVVCVATTTTLTDANTGGTWASDNTSVATISAAGVVTGGSMTGTANITYTLATGCSNTVVVTVNTVPAPSTGATSVCVGSTTTLSNALPGGTWTSSNTGIATVGSTGIVSTLSSTGSVNITYGFSSAGCRTVKALTINAIPNVITGTTSLCPGAVATLSSSGGGVWSSTAMAVGSIGSISTVSGRFAALTAGTTTVSYTFTTGCARSTVVTVNPAPVAGTISATNGFSINTVSFPVTTDLSTSGDMGGMWTSSTPSVATVGSASGTVAAVAAGVTNITYTVTLGACSATATHTVNVTAARSAGENTSTAVVGNAAISLYPNPTKGTITLTTEDAGSFTVYAINGREVGKYSVEKGATTLSLANELAAGVYMCRFTADNGNTMVVRLVLEQ